MVCETFSKRYFVLVGANDDRVVLEQIIIEHIVDMLIDMRMDSSKNVITNL